MRHWLFLRIISVIVNIIRNYVRNLYNATCRPITHLYLRVLIYNVDCLRLIFSICTLNDDNYKPHASLLI